MRKAFKDRPWLWGVVAAVVIVVAIAAIPLVRAANGSDATTRGGATIVDVAKDGSKVTASSAAVDGLALPAVAESDGDPSCDHDIVQIEVVVAPPMTETYVVKEAGWYLPGDESVAFATEGEARAAAQEAGFTGVDAHPYYAQEQTATRTTTAETEVFDACTKCGYRHVHEG